MSSRHIGIILALLWAAPAAAQNAPPAIKARSLVVTITDGLHVKKNYWYIMPEKSPDVYYVEIPRKPHTVTFTTDLASISFDVTFGSRHTFVVRLEDGREALTEIRAEYKEMLPYKRMSAAPAGGVDTIPFTLGDNDKIYVKGRVNGSEPLDFQVDLGAGGSIIKKGSIPKVRMTFDGAITLGNSDGTNAVPSSSKNDLTIAGLAWSGVPFAVADNMTDREDGLIGNTLFQDKVVEIDHDRRVIVLRDALPPMTGTWARQDVVLSGNGVPYMRGGLTIGGVAHEGWFILDTGAYTSILHDDRLTWTSKFKGEFRRLFRGATGGPVISIAGHTFPDTMYSVRRYNGDPADLGVVGNDVLKRLNLVLDNREGVAYFKPNSHMGDPFRNPERMLTRLLALAAAAAVVGIVWRRAR